MSVDVIHTRPNDILGLDTRDNMATAVAVRRRAASRRVRLVLRARRSGNGPCLESNTKQAKRLDAAADVADTARHSLVVDNAATMTPIRRRGDRKTNSETSKQTLFCTTRGGGTIPTMRENGTFAGR